MLALAFYILVKNTFPYLAYLEYLSVKKKYSEKVASRSILRRVLCEPETCLNREKSSKPKRLGTFWSFGLVCGFF